MPDVPERCPFCNSGGRQEETWQGRTAYSFSCGTVCYENGEAAFRYFACYAREKERAIREQLAADRAEAEALRKHIEALEAENERLRQIEAAARTLVDTAFEVPGPDEYVYQAVQVDHFDRLSALLKEGGVFQ